MTDMTSSEIRSRFLRFFEKRGHAVIPSAPLVPENDPSVLFNTAGMQPLVPYLLGAPHPRGTRLADSQKCVRTVDIDEIGDNTHATFFEMLGNWSLGDYFKEEAIRWSYEFLTSEEEGLGLDPGRLYVTVFEGDLNAPQDTEAFDIWKKYIPEHRIYFMGAKSNWWSPGDNGPCGPDTEMFYDVTERGLGDMTKEEYLAADERQDVVEIWNDVFMEYEKKDGKVIGKLANRNVDTGSGLERVAMVVQGKDNIFDTDLLAPIVQAVGQSATVDDPRARRIIADHIRTSVFLVGDGVRPSNKDQGYILRRLIRRSFRLAAKHFHAGPDLFPKLTDTVIGIYAQAYPDLVSRGDEIRQAIADEVAKFGRTLEKGNREFEKRLATGTFTGKDAFDLFTTYGFPLEMTRELIHESEKDFDTGEFETEFRKHQELSRTASAGKFKGGLADHSAKVTAFHTATHLMLAALRKELGEGVHQAGSNITEERTRFDFTYPAKVPRETLDRVEAYVNAAVGAGARVTTTVMDKETARAEGVEGSFWEKYPDKVTVYQVEGPDGTVWSRELCGGPHVAGTGDIAAFGRFQIVKEEASSAGVRRIKAVFGPEV